jgi:hypothetical protein
MDGLGPVSTLLESQVREVIRKHGIVVWLDADDHYSAFVDELLARSRAAALPYAVHAYRGSFLELLLALEFQATGVEKTPLLIHAPGFNEDLIRQTPLLELYSAGVRFRKALETLVSEAAIGKLPPDRVAAFLAQGPVTLAGADAWLSASLNADAGALATSLRHLSIGALVDDLLACGAIAEQTSVAANRALLLGHLGSAAGMPGDWPRSFGAEDAAGGRDIAFLAASWALCVEYVHDLKRPPVDARIAPAAALPATLVRACRELCRHLRARHPSFYASVSEDAADWLEGEQEQARAEDLGSTDTFRFEEEAVFAAALEALAEGRWERVQDWATAHNAEQNFWLRQSAERASAWQLLEAIARLGLAIERAGERLQAEDLDEAVQRYTVAGVAVDQAHRHLEQKRVALLYPRIPEFEAIRQRFDAISERWQRWADAWAVDFNRLCRTEGFVPASGQRQRDLFAEAVEPLLEGGGPVALFLVDALRYEMAEELFRLLEGSRGSRVELQARLAELPTVTAVGMNVLAPVVDRGRLTPKISGDAIVGFSTGELAVADPETRRRAMWTRIGGNQLPLLSLEDVLQRGEAGLKATVSKARLVLVSSLEIDEAGENGAGPAFFDYAIQRLRAAWRLLRDAGVRRFVITADHGFLIVPSARASAQGHGRKIDPKRRHILSRQAADHPAEVRVPLADLGYVGTDLNLIMPETTAVFETGKRVRGFVHGGNSLQERVIPVLTLEHRYAPGSDTTEYAIRARRLEGVAGMHCIEVEVSPAAQTALDFGGTVELDLALRVPEADAVRVDLCQVRGPATLAGASIRAQVGRAFELFFRLSGAQDMRLLVELVHPTAEASVMPCVVDGRFAVTMSPDVPPRSASAASATAVGAGWLERVPDESVRRVFAHLDAHGVVTETEAAAMLGSQRAQRRFALQFEEHARHAPFVVRVESVAGVKRYVKGGGNDDTDPQ